MTADLARSFGRFRNDERGAATVELVFWLPFFFFLFFVVVDASVFFWRYSAMWDVTRDLAREISIRGEVDRRSPTLSADIDNYVQSRLGTAYDADIVDVLAPDPGVQITVQVRSLTVLGFLGFFIPTDEVVTAVRMRNEQD